MSLRQWTAAVLPGTGRCAEAAAWELVRTMMVDFNTELGQLARQTGREGSARVNRQFLSRWLNRDHWEPSAIYTNLNGLTQRMLKSQSEVPLLIDTTDLSDGWVVLQVSVPWERRALPLYRVVYPYRGVERDQVSALAQALDWLEKELPGRRDRYVLVMDRGFPSNPLVTELQQRAWRFVLRVKSNWRMEHSCYTGQMRGTVQKGLVSAKPRMFKNVLLGSGHGRNRQSRANVACFFGRGHAEPWFLVTNEKNAARAVAIYRQRMRIEQEFRDLKGPLGLDLLANWLDRDRVTRFLAWMAVYEWRLAYLWVVHQLREFGRHLQIKGPLSWIRTVREWIKHKIRVPTRRALAWL